MRTSGQYYLPNNEKKCLTSAWAHKQTWHYEQSEETVTKKSLFAFSIAMSTGTNNYISNNIIRMFEESELILMLGQHCWVFRANKKYQLHQKSLKQRDNEGGAPSTWQAPNQPPDPLDVLTVLSC